MKLLEFTIKLRYAEDNTQRWDYKVKVEYKGKLQKVDITSETFLSRDEILDNVRAVM